jgi:hypothetical protein
MAALVGIAPNPGTIPAAHISLQIMDGCRLRPTHDIQGDRLVRVAAEALHLKIQIASIERVTEGR